jgi:N utilization substance protein A
VKSEFMIAITQLAAEKNLPQEVVLQAMEAALVSAYKKDSDLIGNVAVRIDRETGDHHVYLERIVVQEATDPTVEINITEARKIKPDAIIGDTTLSEVHPSHAGRIAAQTAKQVVLQRLREAEREMVFEEFSNREGDVVSGLVQRLDTKHIVIDLGKTEAVLPSSEQARTEHYRPGQRMKFYLLEVHRSVRGPQLVLSRTHKNLLKRLFELEVPEIYRGVVEIKSIAREAGYRSKVAVAARQEGVDPVGSCVGLRGIRIQNIVNELNGERIDVIQWDGNASRFVANALSPAQVLTVEIQEDENTALVVVPDRQLSLAIGKEGQNARLAAKLTGWRIDIKPESAMSETLAAAAPTTEVVTEKPAEAAERPHTDEPWMEVAEIEEPVAAPDEEKADVPEGDAAAESAAVDAVSAPSAPPQEDEAKPAAGAPTSRAKKKKKARKTDKEETTVLTKKAKRAKKLAAVDEALEPDFAEWESDS